MVKCVILSDGFGLNKVLGYTFIDKFINDHGFIDKFYVVIDKKRLMEYKEKIDSKVDYIYRKDIKDIHKYLSSDDIVIVISDKVVFKSVIDSKYIDSKMLYKYRDYLYIFPFKDLNKKKKFKEIKVEVYDENVYEIKRKIIRENNLSFINKGVDIIDIDSTYIDYGCTIKGGTIIYPNSYIKNNSKIGARCCIDGTIDGCTIKDNVTIKNSCVEHSIIDENVSVGPYCYIHEDCLIKVGSIIGSYVELKKSIIGCRCKVKHQSVLLDCIVGDDVNIGAGVITANYDGKMKHISKINDKSFVGCNSVIISPIEIGSNCFVAADTTVVKDVENNSFAISRVSQMNKVINKVAI